MALLPPVIVQLLADTKEFEAKITKANAQMEKLGLTAGKSGGQFAAFANKASTAVIAVGAAMIGYGVDSALKFQAQLDAIRNQSGASATEVRNLGKAIFNISDQTAVSTTDLATAALGIEQAGIRGKAATTLLRDAAKAAAITNTSVVDTTKALISTQTLQIAKGMDVTKLTGILVAGAKDFTGGLSAEEKMLSGRVGVALANYGLKLKDIIGLGSTFTKVGLPARSIASFTTGLANISKPLKDSHNHFTTYAKDLAHLGINASTLQADLRNGNIPALLQNVADAARKGGGQLSTYVNAVFGSTGGATASVLIKNLKEYVKVQQDISKSGRASLENAFGLTSGQTEFRIKKLKTELHNAMTGLGLLLLPAVSDVTNWISNVVKEFQKHPLVAKIATDAALATFAAAIGLKIFNAVRSAFSAIKGWFTTSAITDNTIATQANTDALLGKSGLGAAGAGAAGAEGAAGKVGMLGMVGRGGLIVGGTILGGAIADAVAHKMDNWISTNWGGDPRSQVNKGMHIGGKGGGFYVPPTKTTIKVKVGPRG